MLTHVVTTISGHDALMLLAEPAWSWVGKTADGKRIYWSSITGSLLMDAGEDHWTLMRSEAIETLHMITP